MLAFYLPVLRFLLREILVHVLRQGIDGTVRSFHPHCFKVLCWIVLFHAPQDKIYCSCWPFGSGPLLPVKLIRESELGAVFPICKAGRHLLKSELSGSPGGLFVPFWPSPLLKMCAWWTKISEQSWWSRFICKRLVNYCMLWYGFEHCPWWQLLMSCIYVTSVGTVTNPVFLQFYICIDKHCMGQH